MGGRGTGKSTLLYMLHAAISNNAEYDKSVYSVLKNNLGDGTISVIVQDTDGKQYKIVKTFNEEPQPYKLPGEEHVSINKIIDDISCDIYPASRIEQIGLNGKDRLELIDKMLPNEISDLFQRLDSKRIELNENAAAIKTENAKVSQLQKNLTGFDSVEEMLETHKKEQPKEINEKQKEKFESADKEEKMRADEKRFIGEIEEYLNSLSDQLVNINEEISDFQTRSLGTRIFLNETLLKPLSTSLVEVLKKVRTNNEGIVKNIESFAKQIQGVTETLEEKHEKQQNEFVKLKQAFDKHKAYITKYNKLSKSVDDKKNLQKKLDEAITKRDKIKKQRARIVLEFNKIKQDIFSKRLSKVQELNSGLEGAIRITLTFNGITDEYQELLKTSLQGSGMRYNTLIPAIIQNFSPDRFASIVHNRDEKTMKTIAGIDELRSKAIFDALIETDQIYSIEALYTPDLPEFLLKIREQGANKIGSVDNYLPTDQLSTGQRCTTVLPIVFAVSTNPLIIDQPEDNLDNRYITETIHKMIRKLKGTRQLVFITHNPNIPVLADAEQNIFLRYSGRLSSVNAIGTVQDVKNSILDLLEGGREAFKIRKTLYGE